MSIIANSNLTAGFIDLATYDEQEKYMYGGPDATAYFVRDVRRSTWFTQVPVILQVGSGCAQFGQQWSVNITRAGDYLLYAWNRLLLPTVTISTTSPVTFPGAVVGSNTIRWTKNLMHNLMHETAITFNDLVAEKFGHYFLDFWAGFTTPASKLGGYRNMIGRVAPLTEPHNSASPLPAAFLNLPLPFFFARDSGVALPTAALPYNDMKLQMSYRDWTELLIVDEFDAGGNWLGDRAATIADISGGVAPRLSQCNIWANYAIVSNTERKKMGCAPRDILIEQVQIAPVQTFNPSSQQNFDIRFSHAVKLLFWAIVNTTVSNNRSQYTVNSPIVSNSGLSVVYENSLSFDPIANTTLYYEGTQRLSQVGADYSSLVQPWYHAPTIPDDTGLQMYSYSLSFFDIDPMGSTNYGKLTNVSMVLNASTAAVSAAAGTGPAGSGYDFPQTFSFVILGVNNNIIRISGGAMGFPVL